MSLSLKMAIGAGVFLAIVVLVAAFVGFIRADAARDARDTIIRKNAEAGDAADLDRGGFDACPDGLWDFRAGQCRGPAPRGGH